MIRLAIIIFMGYLLVKQSSEDDILSALNWLMDTRDDIVVQSVDLLPQDKFIITTREFEQCVEGKCQTVVERVVDRIKVENQ